MNAKNIINYLRAGFSLYWIKTDEPNRVNEVICEKIKSFQRKDNRHHEVLHWDCTIEANPMTALGMLSQAEELSCVFAKNFHWFIDKPPVIQAIQNSIPAWQSQGKAFIVVSPVNKIPVELRKDFVILDMDLPDEEEITSAIEHIKPDGFEVKNQSSIISACKGLTGAEVESTLALSLVETDGQEFSIPVINEYKAQAIKKTGFLEVIRPKFGFKEIVGYLAFKRFVMDTINHPKAKGVMTIGPPGCGKTSLMMALIYEAKKFGIAVNMGKLFSKYQGETDQNVDFVINLITSLGENVFVLIDEFEKQFAGSSSTGELDSGVTRRATSRWLDFLQDRPKGIYICGTANSFKGIPPEYLRPGRWDSSPFFIDLPSEKIKMAILKHYCEKTGIKVPQKRDCPKMDMFSGAEIEAMVNIADMREISLLEAEKCVVATAKTAADTVEEIRSWAKVNAVPADDIPGLKAINGGKRKMDV